MAGAWLVHDGSTSRGPAAPPASAAGVQAPGPGAASPAQDGAAVGAAAQSQVAPLARSEPTRLLVPTLRLDAPLVRVGLNAQRHLEPPPLDQPKEAGWYAGGASPGSAGTAVLVGHVDDDHGPAVFFLLGRLRPGDPVQVRLRNGATARFTVDAVRLYPKDGFPDQEVYGTTAGAPQLRLITCGGHWDRRNGYDSNTVVFAHLVA